MSLMYLNTELSTLSAQYFRVIDYKDFTSSAHTYAEPISRFLGLNACGRQELAMRLAAEIRQPYSSSALLKPDENGYLEWFFSPARDRRWDLLSSGSFDIKTLDNMLGEGDTGEAALDYQCDRRHLGPRRHHRGHGDNASMNNSVIDNNSPRMDDIVAENKAVAPQGEAFESN
eukprot:m.147151 g.147151  ORF g.147151 m.147151 type:complete len:173 (+) comp17779_c0_seq1:932-1450(+)